jgi:hypothetical protein
MESTEASSEKGIDAPYYRDKMVFVQIRTC